MTKTTQSPAEVMAERVMKTVRQTGHLDVAPKRQAAAKAALKKIAFPTTRDERWKYTRTNRLQKLSFQCNQDESVSVPEILPGFHAHRLTFVNGRLQSGSTIAEKGVFIGPLSSAIAHHPEKVTALESDHFSKNEWFAALQASAPQDGGAIFLDDNVTLKQPVLLHHHLTGGTAIAQPQHLVVIGQKSKAQVIIWTTCDTKAKGLSNAAITSEVAENAHLTMEIVQDEQGEAYHIGHHQFRQAASSHIEVRTATARSHWLRNDLHIQQDGKNGTSTFHGCYLPNGNQFVDHHTRIDHAQPDGKSDELYKGLAAESATAVFNGKIMVHPDAQRIEAYQSNANLILGEKATVNSKPELEIYADDVRCSHGCTTGQFDEEALFYMRSRGMTETAARNLLVRAFLAEVLEGFRPEIQKHVESVYAERLGWT